MIVDSEVWECISVLERYFAEPLRAASASRSTICSRQHPSAGIPGVSDVLGDISDRAAPACLPIEVCGSRLIAGVAAPVSAWGFGGIERCGDYVGQVLDGCCDGPERVGVRCWFRRIRLRRRRSRGRVGGGRFAGVSRPIG